MTTDTIGFFSYASVDEAEQTERDRFTNLIAFPPIDPDWNGVGANIMIPNSECGLTIEEVARKDVPEGSPFVILTYNDFPWEDSFNIMLPYHKSWVIDFSNPDGIGENENG